MLCVQSEERDWVESRENKKIGSPFEGLPHRERLCARENS